MKITTITAPEKYYHRYNDAIVFLAGGITNCKNWQDLMIQSIKNNITNKSYYDFNLILANPRRENFPINDPSASYEQIEWEFCMLQKMGYFLMYFDGPTDSDQPICFYELGRNLYRMQIKYGNSWYKRCFICVNDDFKRINDVIIQTKLASDGLVKVNVVNNRNIKEQFDTISKNIINQIGEDFI